MSVLVCRRILAAILLLPLFSGCSCRREEPPAPIKPKAAGVVAGTQTLAARLPRQAGKDISKSRRMILSLKFLRYPVEVQANHKFAVEVQVLDAFGKPLNETNATVVLTLAKSPQGVDAFSGGITMKQTRAGIAVFDDLTLEMPGDYVLEAQANDERALGDPVRVIPELPRTVNLVYDGRVTKAQFTPPDTYTTADGDTYSGIPVGKSEFVIDGIRYEVLRHEDANVDVKTLGPEEEKTK